MFISTAGNLDARHNNIDIDHESSYSAGIQSEFPFLTLTNRYEIEILL